MKRKPLQQQGFTLNELLIAVAVLAIAIAASIPSFQGMLANQRVRSAADALATSVMYARSEAIKRNTSVQIASLDDDWNTGWEVKASGVSSSLRSEEISGVLLTGFATGVKDFSIGRDGRIGTTYTVTICDTNNYAVARVVTISFSGMTRVNQSERCGS